MGRWSYAIKKYYILDIHKVSNHTGVLTVLVLRIYIYNLTEKIYPFILVFTKHNFQKFDFFAFTKTILILSFAIFYLTIF